MRESEITFARGDILRQVLKKTGLAAKRPLNLRKSGIDSAHSAQLLRNLRSMSQRASMLSSKLDDLIEFEYPEAVMKSVWNKIKKPSRQTFGKIMRRHDPRSSIPTMVFREQAHMFSAKDYSTRYPKEVLESVWKKLKKPRKPSPYPQSFHGGEYHDDPKWVNKDIKKSRRENKGLSSRLDEVINFADPRPRNPLGEFSPQHEGGPDPNAMATVYKMPQQQQPQGGGFGSTAGTLLTGGALGAIGGSAGKAGWAGMAQLVKNLAKKAKKK